MFSWLLIRDLYRVTSALDKLSRKCLRVQDFNILVTNIFKTCRTRSTKKNALCSFSERCLSDKEGGR
jgi:hypothetical protein